tara:strand:+ start:1092 stop:1460 length:369 start_codon:yes stop_codon:yes gene_type:complete
MYYLAAKMTLIIHFVFILFVIFGGLLFFISKKTILFHVPTLIYGIYIELAHRVCPLTYLENWLLYKANLKGYSTGFVQKYIEPIVYPPFLTDTIQISLAMALIIINLIIYGYIFLSTKSKKP